MHVFCIFVFAPVRCTRACFTWKGTSLEILSLLLLLLLLSLLVDVAGLPAASFSGNTHYKVLHSTRSGEKGSC